MTLVLAGVIAAAIAVRVGDALAIVALPVLLSVGVYQRSLLARERKSLALRKFSNSAVLPR
jgi:hypothetical protein